MVPTSDSTPDWTNPATLMDWLKPAWDALPKPLPPGSEPFGSRGHISWSSRLFHPIPHTWPPQADGRLDYYAFATGTDFDGLKDGFHVGPVWAVVVVDVHSPAEPTLTLLANEIRARGTHGVRMLSRAEAELFSADTEIQACLKRAVASREIAAFDAPRFRDFYQLRAQDCGVGDTLRARHPAFFAWIDG